jgi:lipopolysaccharide export system protein LptA
MKARIQRSVLKGVILACTLSFPLGFPYSLFSWAVEGDHNTSTQLQRDSLVTIESDVQQADNQTGIVTATGNVRITYAAKGMVATSKQAQYFSKEGRLVLSGDVDVIDADGQRIQAERLVYQLDQERLLAQPAQGKQVMSKLKLSSPTPPKEPGLPVP